jgi:hypothetical protein
VFRPGDVVKNLGNGTIQINEVIGTEANIQAEVQRAQQAGEASNNGSCPVTKD